MHFSRNLNNHYKGCSSRRSEKEKVCQSGKLSENFLVRCSNSTSRFSLSFRLPLFFSLFLSTSYAGLRDIYESKFPKKAKRSLRDAINVVVWKYDNWLIFSGLRGGARSSCCWQSVVVNRRSEATTFGKAKSRRRAYTYLREWRSSGRTNISSKPKEGRNNIIG